MLMDNILEEHLACKLAYTSSVMIKATDSNGSQTKYVTFPKVECVVAGGSVTWNTNCMQIFQL